MNRIEQVSANRPTAARIVISGLALLLLGGAVWWTVSALRGDSMSGGGAMSAADPHAGMDMGGGAGIALSADQLRQFGITFGTVEPRAIVPDARVSGIVTAAESKITHVTSKLSGFAERLYVATTGEKVVAGQRLLELYSPQLIAAQEELLLAARLPAMQSGQLVPGIALDPRAPFNAARDRMLLWDISPAQVDSVVAEGRARRTLTLHATADGVVTSRTVFAGGAVAAGEVLYSIADLSEVWIEAEMRESESALAQEGSRVQVIIPALPGWSTAGRVSFVYPTMDEMSRTVRARIVADNRSARLKPGMYATVLLQAAGRTALSVENSAILHTGSRSVVFRVMPDGKVEPVEIVTGLTSSAYTEVLEGLESGQRVVTSAQYLLDSESNLAEVMRAMMVQMGDADMSAIPGSGMGAMPADTSGGGDHSGHEMGGRGGGN